MESALKECREYNTASEVMIARITRDMLLDDRQLVFTVLNCVSDHIDQTYVTKKNYYEKLIRDNGLFDSITASTTINNIDLSYKLTTMVIDRLRKVVFSDIHLEETTHLFHNVPDKEEVQAKEEEVQAKEEA